jgi:hypothetical protein
MKLKTDIAKNDTMGNERESLRLPKHPAVSLSLIAVAAATALLANVAVAQSDSAIAERRARLCSNHPTVCGASAGTPQPGDSSGVGDHLWRMRPSAHSLKQALKKVGPQIMKNGVVMVMPIPVREALYQAELRAAMRRTTAQIQAGQTNSISGAPAMPLPGTLAGGPLSTSGTAMQPGVATNVTLAGNQKQQVGSPISPEAQRLDLQTCKATGNCR